MVSEPRWMIWEFGLNSQTLSDFWLVALFLGFPKIFDIVQKKKKNLKKRKKKLRKRKDKRKRKKK